MCQIYLQNVYNLCNGISCKHKMSELYFNTAYGKQCSLNRKKYTRIQNVYTVSLSLKRQSQQKFSVLLAAEMI